MNEQEAEIDALETLIAHCQVMAKAKSPQRRIAASRLEIQLTAQRDTLRGLVPMAACFVGGRDADPAEGTKQGGS